MHFRVESVEYLLFFLYAGAQLVLERMLAVPMEAGIFSGYSMSEVQMEVATEI